MFAVYKGSTASLDMCPIETTEGLVCIGLLKDLSKVPRFRIPCCDLHQNI